jgi:hypothetical protein
LKEILIAAAIQGGHLRRDQDHLRSRRRPLFERWTGEWPGE